MAKQVVVTLIDDYDGQSPANETVQFAIDGTSYELDLSMPNATKLRGLLEPWTDKARKVGRPTRTKTTGRTPRPTVDREQTHTIREWAKANGHDVSSRGRISVEITQAYHKAMAS